MGFNPRTRVGCDLPWLKLNFLAFCFNPRTRVGCDVVALVIVSALTEFQSTHPCGVRRNLPLACHSLSVSIHAPVWGATTASMRLSVLAGFQSTHPCGVRQVRLLGHCDHCEFQSTHPCGVRRMLLYTPDMVARFNPRTRVGCDCPILPRNCNRRVSIHAPVWGATFVATAIDRYRVVSIHAPVWGATVLAGKPQRNGVFQSTHPCGVRPAKRGYQRLQRGFNPRTRVGCDNVVRPMACKSARFNPRTRVGCDYLFKAFLYW